MKQRVMLTGGVKALVLVTGAVFAVTMFLAAFFDPGGLSPSLAAGNLLSAAAIAAVATRLLPEPVGVARMTFDPATSSRIASSCAG